MPEVKYFDPLDLDLDPKNPRLSADEEGSTQSKLLKIMIDRFKLDELGESIVDSGFLDFDPLIGWMRKDRITILEGNRRVAALKLLLKPDLAPESQHDSWKQLSQKLSKSQRAKLESVRVAVYENRDDVDLTSYIGFRHVTGVLQWPALEKANFIAQLIEERNWSYTKVAERLGTYPKHVERHYVAHQIVQQATAEGFDTKELRSRSFGVLMRALQARGVAEFLGISYPGDPRKSKKPVPQSRLDNLKFFIEWTFGTEKHDRLIRDSRLLTDWGRILQSEEAVAYLKRATNPSFDRAYLKSGGQSESVAEALTAAADRLEECVALMPAHKKNKEVQAAVKQCASFFVQIIANFPRIQADYGLKLGT